MKSALSILLTVGALFGASAGCSEPTRPESASNPPPVASVPIPPVAYVGPNMSMPFPFQSLELTGYGLATESPIARYSWTKVSGPGSYFVGSPDVQRAEVAGMEKGTYVFEMTVADMRGLRSSARITVDVYEARVPGAKQLNFKNLAWNCPMGCSAEIKNFHNYLPVLTPIRVFVATGSTWVEAKPEREWTPEVSYVYGIRNGTFFVYTDGATGSVDLQVLY